MLEFRPHHFLCTLGFKGEGYSEDFVRNFWKIVEELRAGPGAQDSAGDEVEILVVESSDSICGPCPNRQGEGCVSSAKIRKLDVAHAQILGLKAGDRLTWGEAKKILVEKMDKAKFEAACEPCSWKSMGVCWAALEALRKVRPRSFLMAIGIGLSLLISGGVRADDSLESLRATLHSQAISVSRKGRPIRQRKTRTSSVTQKIAQAFNLLQSGKLKETGAFAIKIEGDPLFADYGYWLSAQAKIREAQDHLLAGRYPKALLLSEAAAANSLRIIGEFPYSPFVRTAQKDIAAAELVKGSTYCAQKNWISCRGELEKAFQRGWLGGPIVGNGEVVGLTPAVLEAYGQACLKAGSETCGPWLSKLASTYPRVSPEFRALSKYLPAKWERAKPLATPPRLGKIYRATDSDQAAFESGINAYFEKKFAEAARQFQRFLDDFPRSSFRYRTLYWLARTLEKDGKSLEAQKVFDSLLADSPLTYYGLLGALAKSRDFDSEINAKQLAIAQVRDPNLLPAEVFRIGRAELLIRDGAGTLAANELKDLKARDTLSSGFLLYVVLLENEAGYYTGAFSILNELIARGYPGIYSPDVVKFIFPTPFFNEIRNIAHEVQLDPILLLSLVKQESSFDPNAISTSGAQGLTQLMPTTALDVSPGLVRGEFFEVKTNLRTGAKYLSRLLSRFNGNIVLALAAYNAGTGPAERWFRANPQRMEMAEFVETIPFRETREYVAAIIRNYFWYSKLLKSPDAGADLNTADPPKSPIPVAKNSQKVNLDYFWAPYKTNEKAPKLEEPTN